MTNKYNKMPMISYGIFALLLIAWLIYASLTGWRIFTFDSSQQNWKSSGPGYHK